MNFQILKPLSFLQKLLPILFLLPFFALAQSEYTQAVKYFQEQKFSKAKPIFENHLKQNPNDNRTKEYLGDIAAHAKDWDTAISYYEALAKATPSSANIHYKYGGAMAMKMQSISRLRAVSYIGDVKREFETAANLDPKHIEVRWALIEYYLQLPSILGGSEKKAIAYAKELSKISPVDGYLSEGHIFEYSEKYKEAEKSFKNAIEVGQSPHTYQRLVNLYLKADNPNKALETALESLRLHQDNNINYQIGEIVAESNIQSANGIECLGNYISNYTKEDRLPKAWAYYRLAQIHRNLRNKQIALTWINKALIDMPNFKEAKKERSLILAL